VDRIIKGMKYGNEALKHTQEEAHIAPQYIDHKNKSIFFFFFCVK
jgi:hypothetical protein